MNEISGIFIAGRHLFIVKEPEGNVVVLVTKCMWVGNMQQ